MKKVFIVIPCINLWSKYTKQCIESIKTVHDATLVLIDNNSSDETQIEAAKLVNNNFIYHRNNECWSCARSWNFGINLAFDSAADYVLVLNNDVILHPMAIDRMIERFEDELSNPPIHSDTIVKELGMVTCLNIKNEIRDPREIFNLPVKNNNEVAEFEHPDFSGFMINKSCWNKVGEADEEFYPAYYEDNSYHYKMTLSGMKAICLPSALFYHYGSATQNEAYGVNNPVVPGPAYERNKAEYAKMWGGLPGFEVYKTKYNK
jgi:GT2 family glycosyltransferase